ncbi:glutathione binding-like protein, partial [SAR116 cluster bacterium]|nr:glutathione binding-like protein [SAR116 cluster bacterium]
IEYAVNRYSKEANRLYGVLDRRLEGREFVADDYSIADIAIFPWTRTHERQNVDLADYSNVERWRQTMINRPAVQRGMQAGAEFNKDLRDLTPDQWKRLFGA